MAELTRCSAPLCSSTCKGVWLANIYMCHISRYFAHIEIRMCTSHDFGRFENSHYNITCLPAVPVARMSTGVRASLVDKVKEMAQKHKVVVFAKSYCPYCMQVGLCRLLKSYILPPVSSMAHC